MLVRPMRTRMLDATRDPVGQTLKHSGFEGHELRL
jgi:hypothetical protein